MGKPSAPEAPNPYQSAQAQYQYGTEAATYGKALNDTNTITPTGSTSFQQTGTDPTTGAPITTETTKLSPEQQAILSGEQGAQIGELGAAPGALASYQRAAAAGTPGIAPVQYGPQGNIQPVQGQINTSGVPGIVSPMSAEDYGQSKALAGEMAALQPGQKAQFEQLDASLRNSGNLPGSPAYNQAMSQLQAQIGGQDTQAAGAAITAGTGLEQALYGESANTNQQLFGEAAQKGQFANTAEGQQFGQGLQRSQFSNEAGGTALADYAQQLGIPLNDLQTLIGNPVSSPSAPAAVAQGVSTPDIMSAFQNQYQGQLNAYNAEVGQQNALYGDAATLGTLAYLAYAAPAAA